MTRTKASEVPSLHRDQRRRMSYTIGDDNSTYDMLVTLSQGDQVLGQFRMDWEHWPFQPELISRSNAWMKVIDILYELGCWFEEQEQSQTKSHHE